MTVWGITDFGDAACDHGWSSWVEKRRGPAILITKNATKLLTDFPYLLNQEVIIHATITGYGDSIFEPGVPSPESILDFLSKISPNKKKQIVIRIDPIIPVNEMITRSKQIYTKAHELGFERIRISILDLYPHVLQRFEKLSPSLVYELKQIYNWDLAHSTGEHQDYMIHCDYQLRKQIIDFFPGVEICAEPPFRGTPCISYKDIDSLGLKRENFSKPTEKQRKFCGCLEKRELLQMNSACPHGCIYCYIKKPFEIS
jgi:DNA repair photolyase